MDMNNKLPITRLGKFFSQEDFDINIQMGQEYLHGDLNMKFVLYRVDRTKTDTDSIYAEVGKDEIKFFPPIEVNGLVQIAEAKNSSYKAGLVRYLEPGNLTIKIYLSHLDDLNVKIIYGDFVGYAESEETIRFYQVIDDGRIQADGKHKMFGYKPHYLTIVCAPVQESEFRGI
jgi:hypothetical protein